MVSITSSVQTGIGDGGMYSLWAGLLVVSELLIVLVWWKGGSWREKATQREEVEAERSRRSAAN